jgi:hypothetical protein
MTVRRKRATFAALATVPLVIGLAVPAHAGASTTATAGGTTVSVAIPDVVYEGPDCMDAPIRANFSEVEVFASFHLMAARTGSLDAITASVMSTADGFVTDVINVCPRVDTPGTYNVSGTLNTSVEGSSFTPASFRVSRAPTRFATMSATYERRTLTVRGRIAAITATGSRSARGTVRIFGILSERLGGTGQWTSIGSAYPDANGAFSVSGTSRTRLNGMYIRAVLQPEFWCMASRRTVRIPLGRTSFR